VNSAGFIKFENRNEGFSRLGLALLLPFVILVGAYVVYQLFLIPGPVVRGIEAFDYLPLDKTVKLQTGNVVSIDISVYQDGRKVELLKDAPDAAEKSYTLRIRPKDLKLKDGRAITVITAGSGILKKAEYNITSLIDTVPPDLQVARAPSVIYQGGGGFAVLRAADADSVFIEIAGRTPSGEEQAFRRFRAYAVADSRPEQADEEPGQAAGGYLEKEESTYCVFFPAPFDIKRDSVFYAVAEDPAGNRSVKALPTRLIMKKYRSSSIRINDNFIRTVIAPLLNETDITDPEASFRMVNEEWRKNSEKRLIEIAGRTEPEILWDGPFLQLKNSKVMAVYGDRRTYYYNKKAVSKSVHLGYDLASFARAPVEAANTGVVRFAGKLGIFGNAVIIDHGLGLMSLYGHMSEIMAHEGQAVRKGDIIGKTGATGLAGGDHLHFGVLIGGYEVSPLYWWDPRWIKTNVTDYLP